MSITALLSVLKDARDEGRSGPSPSERVRFRGKDYEHGDHPTDDASRTANVARMGCCRGVESGSA